MVRIFGFTVVNVRCRLTMGKEVTVLHLLVFTCICLSTVGACIPGCVCDQTTHSVQCANIENSTLNQLFSDIPANTRVLSVTNSMLIQPVDEESEDEVVIVDLHHLQYLRSVTLTRTNITESDLGVFNHIASLREIHVTLCNVRQLYASEWSLLHNLDILNLSRNAIADIEEQTFEGLTSLRMLILSHNNLQHVPISAYQDLNSLEQVDLSYNAMEYIHPMTFYNMSHLEALYLQHNKLHTLHSSMFLNMSQTLQIDLNENPWDCNCGLFWLITGIANPGSHRNHFVEWQNLHCDLPTSLKGAPLHTVDGDDLVCQAPNVSTSPDSVEIHNMQDETLNCSAAGEPQPSVYWVTPFGTLAHQNHRRWMSESVPKYRHVMWYAGQPTYFNSSIHALPNGSLAFHQFRYYFVGEYTCVVENPAGLMSVSVNVTIAANINHHFEYSVIIGFIAGLVILCIGVFVGLIRMCAEKVCQCCKERGQYKVDVTFVVDTPHGEEHIDYNFEEPYDYSPFSDGTWPRFTPFLPHWSPYHSPKKCVTPAEGLGDEEEIKDGGTIRDTLEDVRSRLRQGLERASGRLRNRTQTVKENTSKKIQTIKESTSQTMQTIKESGSLYVKNLGKATGDYAQRVKVGVAVGVHQVKSQVQSMKELCGTGNIAQTVSVATVLAEKDKLELEEIDLQEIAEESDPKDIEQGVVTDEDWDNCQASTSGAVSSSPSRVQHQRASLISSEDSFSLNSTPISCKADVHGKDTTLCSLDQNQLKMRVDTSQSTAPEPLDQNQLEMREDTSESVALPPLNLNQLQMREDTSQSGAASPLDQNQLQMRVDTSQSTAPPPSSEEEEPLESDSML